MLNRALMELEVVVRNPEMSGGEVRHCVGIAIDEIRNVLTLLDAESKERE